MMLQMPNQAVDSAASSHTSNMDCVPSRWRASGQTEGGHGASSTTRGSQATSDGRERQTIKLTWQRPNRCSLCAPRMSLN